MLESLVSEKASGGRRVLRKEIEPKQSLDKMIIFLRNSYFWPYLLKFTDYVENCCDLSQFWFREFYLEIETGKRIQVSNYKNSIIYLLFSSPLKCPSLGS
jgi:cytoplasmic FMR1 interacting protein